MTPSATEVIRFQSDPPATDVYLRMGAVAIGQTLRCLDGHPCVLLLSVLRLDGHRHDSTAGDGPLENDIDTHE